jgi:hypothetical protein
VASGLLVMSFDGRRLSPTTAGDTLLPAMSWPSLPDIFCWTRFGTEAGEDMPRILQRKEVERLAHHGLFYWGIGNSVGRAIRELANLTRDPEVLFSPIIGRPRPVDVAPGQVVRWISARRQLNELSDDIATRVSVLYFGDAREALVKALGE